MIKNLQLFLESSTRCTVSAGAEVVPSAWKNTEDILKLPRQWQSAPSAPDLHSSTTNLAFWPNVTIKVTDTQAAGDWAKCAYKQNLYVSWSEAKIQFSPFEMAENSVRLPPTVNAALSYWLNIGIFPTNIFLTWTYSRFVVQNSQTCWNRQKGIQTLIWLV